jgi:hypothetical protein
LPVNIPLTVDLPFLYQSDCGGDRISCQPDRFFPVSPPALSAVVLFVSFAEFTAGSGIEYNRLLYDKQPITR